MNQNQGLTTRQMFRGGIIENITLGIVVLPYITVRFAGQYHWCAFFLGMLFTLIYGLFMKRFAWTGEGCLFLELIYVLRFVLRSAILLLFFGAVVKEYLLPQISEFWIIGSFLFICAYGATKDVSKRGRLMELLYWWMMLPLLLAVVFAIGNMEIRGIPHAITQLPEDCDDMQSILFAAYLVVLVTSSVELLQFQSHRKGLTTDEKKDFERVFWRILGTMVFALTLGFLFVMGILGAGWSGSSPLAALNVMEAAKVPGGFFTRMDYPVLAFWMLGIFALISGYLFYAKEFLYKVCGVQQDRGKRILFSILFLVVIGLLFLLQQGVIETEIRWYLLYAELPLSMLLPVCSHILQRKRKL